MTLNPLLFLFPGLAILVWLKLRDANSRKRTLQRQLAALRLNSGLKNLLMNVQRHRGMVNALLKGDESFKTKATALQSDIQTNLSALYRMSKAEALYPSEINRITIAWGDLKEQALAMPVEKSFSEHVHLIEDILALLITVAEQNQLYANKVYSVAYVDILWRLVPTTAEAVGRARAVGSGIAAAGEILTLDRIRLGFLINKIKTSMREVGERIDQAIDADRRLTRRYHEVDDGLESFVAEVERQLLVPDKPDVQAREFFDAATSHLNRLFAFYEEGEKHATGRVEEALARATGAVKILHRAAMVSMVLLGFGSYFLIAA